MVCWGTWSNTGQRVRCDEWDRKDPGLAARTVQVRGLQTRLMDLSKFGISTSFSHFRYISHIVIMSQDMSQNNWDFLGMSRWAPSTLPRRAAINQHLVDRRIPRSILSRMPVAQIRGKWSLRLVLVSRLEIRSKHVVCSHPHMNDDHQNKQHDSLGSSMFKPQQYSCWCLMMLAGFSYNYQDSLSQILSRTHGHCAIPDKKKGGEMVCMLESGAKGWRWNTVKWHEMTKHILYHQLGG